MAKEQSNIQRMAVAIPMMSDASLHFVQNLRQQYDIKGYSFIGPHFTIFPPNATFSQQALSENLHQYVAQSKKIFFSIRAALFMPPLMGHSSWYAFLIPDEGFSQIFKMHRAYHSGSLQSAFNTDFPFIPHITVGSFKNKTDCMQVVHALNTTEIELIGCIEKIALIEAVDGVAHIFDEIYLK